MIGKSLTLTAVIIIFPFASFATIINIPADYPAIQQGIDASVNGDTVLVQPGFYYEDIDIVGRFMTVASLYLTTGNESYIQTTIINATEGAAVRIAYCITGDPVLIGFTITGGSIGVQCLDSNPVVGHNYIDQINDAVIYGDAYSAGIKCEYSNARLYSNIIDNIISSSSFGAAEAYGVHCISSDPVLYNNIITEVLAISAVSETGSGLYCEYSNPIVFNNTIINNGLGGSGGVLSLYSNPFLLNDIVWYNSGSQISGTVTANYCNVNMDLPGEGNINVEPALNNYHLKSIACGDNLDSPCIDAGSPLILDSLLDCGWGLGTIASDMGAFGGGDWSIVGIDDHAEAMPKQLSVFQNYPNPFNANTTIRFALSESGNIELAIYDLLGRRIDVLVNEYVQAGMHNITFDASSLSSGVYFYRLRAGDAVETKRMVLLK